MMELAEEALDNESHFFIIDDFCSGPECPLDTFLKCNAFEFEECRLGNTYLIFTNHLEEKILVGYYTIKVNGLQMEVDGVMQSIPVVELSRIAISHQLQNKGIGELIFYKYILPRVKKIATVVAIYGMVAFVEEEGLNEKQTDNQATCFYKKLNFVPSPEEVKQIILDQFNSDCRPYVLKL